jgi:hypothetical protein
VLAVGGESRIYHLRMFASWVRAQFEHVPSVNLPSSVQVFYGIALFALVFASVFFGSYWFIASIVIVRLLFLMDPSGDSQDASHFQSKAASYSRKRKRSGLAARPRVTWHFADVSFDYESNDQPNVLLNETVTMQVYGNCPKAAGAALRKIYPERSNISVTKIQRTHS